MMKGNRKQIKKKSWTDICFTCTGTNAWTCRIFPVFLSFFRAENQGPMRTEERYSETSRTDYTMLNERLMREWCPLSQYHPQPMLQFCQRKYSRCETKSWRGEWLDPGGESHLSSFSQMDKRHKEIRRKVVCKSPDSFPFFFMSYRSMRIGHFRPDIPQTVHK